MVLLATFQKMATEESNSAAINASRNQVCGQSRLFLSIDNNLNLANSHNSILLSQYCTAASILVLIARLSLITAFNSNNIMWWMELFQVRTSVDIGGMVW
jgi:hypothetical protein